MVRQLLLVLRLAVGSALGCGWPLPRAFPPRWYKHHDPLPATAINTNASSDRKRRNSGTPVSIYGIGPVCTCRTSVGPMEPVAVGRGADVLRREWLIHRRLLLRKMVDIKTVVVNSLGDQRSANPQKQTTPTINLIYLKVHHVCAENEAYL
jgi:hypothetical protein